MDVYYKQENGQVLNIKFWMKIQAKYSNEKFQLAKFSQILSRLTGGYTERKAIITFLSSNYLN